MTQDEKWQARYEEVVAAPFCTGLCYMNTWDKRTESMHFSRMLAANAACDRVVAWRPLVARNTLIGSEDIWELVIARLASAVCVWE